MNKAVPNGEKAVLVHIDFDDSRYNEEIDEFVKLAESADLKPQATITGTRRTPSAKFFVGSGKVCEIRECVAATCAEVVVFNHAISPSQERNLEREINCRVIDRVGLILDIFAQRARSYEGKLQVELAQLQYLSTRLVRGWTHLERQKGGIGLRGPGETQLETDRRLIGHRIRNINRHLDKVKCQRQQSRRLRKRNHIPVVSMVGYTNAGKTTLFNSLTGAHVYAADKLFATLDTTLRKLEIVPGRQVVLSDTVGFIRHIPHDLIEAFHGTLDEVREADLLLHVIDSNDEQRASHIQQVDKVVEEIGAADVPRILVFNKIDCNGNPEPGDESHAGAVPRVRVSAATGAGLDRLRELIERCLEPVREQHVLKLPPEASRARARLFASGVVEHEDLDGQGNWILQINIDAASLQKFCRENGLNGTITRAEPAGTPGV